MLQTQHGVPLWILILGIIICLAVVSVLAAAEGALARITRSEAAEALADNKRGAERIVTIVNERRAARRALAAFRTFFEMLTAVCLTLAMASVLTQWWQALLAAVGLAALLVGVLAGMSPTRIGRVRPVATLGYFSAPLWAITRLALRFGVGWPRPGRENTGNGGRGRAHEGPHPERHSGRDESGDDLSVMVERVSESQEIEDDERELLQSLFRLGRTQVREVMVPRTDMVVIESGETLDQAVTLFLRSGFSRMPVVGESSDDVVGVLYFKDVMRHLHHRTGGGSEPIDPVMRPARFIPEFKLVDDTLAEMQADSVHIALAVDEYGGIAGLVTIEDLLEELVGELVDEHDHAEPESTQLPDGSWSIPARMDLEELGKLFDIDLDDDDVETAGGLLTKALGRIPGPGDWAQVAGIILRVERVEGKRQQLATLVASLADTDQPTGSED